MKNFCEFEHVANSENSYSSNNPAIGFYNPDRRLSFKTLFPDDVPDVEIKALIEFDGSQPICDHYQGCTNTPGFIASGIINLYDYAFYGNCALPIDMLRTEALVGEPLCWSTSFAEWYVETNKMPEFLIDKRATDPISEIRRRMNTVELNGQYILMSAPGQDIYGHWIIDIIPRLYFLSLDVEDKIPIIFDSLPVWAKFFLDAFSIDQSRIIDNPNVFFKISHAIIPTSCKSGYRIGPKAAKSAWDVVNNYYDFHFPSEKLPPTRKIFLSRSEWSASDRNFTNRDDMERIALENGYEIIHPQTLSIAEQIGIMREAKIVVGEDGSALHNVVFGQSGLRLGVISLANRDNLWHLGICQIMSHRISYCFANEGGEVDLEKFTNFLCVLEKDFER